MSAADGRVYVTPLEATTVGTAVQDIIAMKSGATNGIRIHWIHLECSDTTDTPIRMRLRRATATVTLGSGGTVPTISAVDANDTKAATAVVHLNDTTQATTSGAFTTLMGFQWDTVLPWDYLPPPEDRPASAGAGDGFVLDLPAVLGASHTVSGFIKWSEAP